MDARTRWAVWLAATVVSFLALEARALREPLTDGKPSETLSAALRWWLGIQPAGRRRWVATYASRGHPTTSRDGGDDAMDTIRLLLVPLSLLLLALAYLIGGRVGQVMAVVAASGAGVATLLSIA